jgi:hypothetical protein
MSTPTAFRRCRSIVFGGLRAAAGVFGAAALVLVFAACGETESPAENGAGKAGLATTAHPDTAGWERLFRPGLPNAETASPDSWAMENGVLRARDRTTLWSDSSYGDFVLDFEARAPDGTNSGVFFRTADTSDILSALELQMLNPAGPDSAAAPNARYGGRNGMGALYDLKGPSGGSLTPGGWNRFTITARDSMVYVVMNGTQIHRMNLARWTEPGRRPDGTEHKFDRALADQASSGPIGLQGIHSDRGVSVEYRNLRIRRLDGASGSR